MVNQFRVGTIEVNITPPVGLPMDGYMVREGISLGVHDPLLAKLLILEDTHMRVALVALDVLGVGTVFSHRLRRSLATVLHTSPDSILICATHTHAGPSGLQNWISTRASAFLDPQLIGQIEARLTDAAASALK